MNRSPTIPLTITITEQQMAGMHVRLALKSLTAPAASPSERHRNLALAAWHRAKAFDWYREGRIANAH